MKHNGIKLAAALLALSALSFSLLAAEPVTAQTAEAAAAAVVPEGSSRIITEYDDLQYEVKYYHETKRESYEVKVDPVSGAVTEFESRLLDNRGGRSFTFAEEDAKKAVTAELGKAEILSTLRDYDDGYAAYEIQFKADTCYGSYTIHSETGAVLERDIRIGVLASGDIGLDKAREIAQAQVPGAYLVKCKLEREDHRLVYEAELYLNGWEYEYEIDAATGAILSMDRDFDD